MKITSLGNYIFEKGDYVKIKGTIIHNKHVGRVGRVISVNGGYVYIKLNGQEFERELYHFELEPAVNYLRKLKLEKLGRLGKALLNELRFFYF